MSRQKNEIISSKYKFTCRFCGKEFATDHESDFYCSKSCKRKAIKAKMPSPLSEDARRARELGLTYGQYKARQYWEYEGPRMRARALDLKHKIEKERIKRKTKG